MLSAIIASVVTAILTLIGTLFIQKRNSENRYRKDALYLYLNLRQIKKAIDDDKKCVDSNKMCNLLPYSNQIDYIGVICNLNDKLENEDVLNINDFFEKVKILNNAKMYYIQIESIYNNPQTKVQNMSNPYEQQRNTAYQSFVYYINDISNDENYKKNIVEIISKLEKLKDK